VIPISPCAGRLKIKEWLMRKQFKYSVTTPGIEEPSEKLSSTLLALDSKNSAD
jgi:hypothetical protein